MILVTALLGALSGAGAWLAWRAVTPRSPALADVLVLPPAAEVLRDGDQISWAARTLRACGLDPARRSEALRLAGTTPERYALDKLVGLLAGAAGGVVIASAAAVMGLLTLGPFSLVLVAGFAAAGFLLPDVELDQRAERRRQAFRHALSAYLDLVNIVLAGGGGIETSLHAAADAGDGWAFATIREALDRARLTGRSPWEVFSDLGTDLGVSELTELAASVSLAGSHGARIRQSLAAKADTLRGHQIAETESAAEAATERMTIPVTILLFGFLVFIAYPAVMQITSTTGASP